MQHKDPELMQRIQDFAESYIDKYHLSPSMIPCGSPNEAHDAVEDYVALPTCIFGDEDMYVLRTTGKSMMNAGIAPGDYVVVKNTQFANDGDIVVALKDNANTLKRFLYDENGIPYFHPENEAMKDIKLKKGESFSIQGVVRFIIKAV